MNWTRSRNGNLTTECKWEGISVKIEVDNFGRYKGVNLEYNSKNYHDGFYDYPIIFSGKMSTKEDAIKYIEDIVNEPLEKEIKKKTEKITKKVKKTVEVKEEVLNENNTVVAIELNGADKVKYTTDGKDITQFSKVYKDPITVPRGIILKIKRYFKDGRTEDEEMEVK